MSISEYNDRGPVEITPQLDLHNLIDKSVIITGGASGLGLTYAKAFVNAGAFVTIADYDERAGQEAEANLSPNAKFVKCDVRIWDEQVAVFEAANAASPCQSVDVVIANAGVIGADDLNTLQDPLQPPKKPDLRIVEINLIGTAYTSKLAMHYFRRQNTEPSESRDRCLIIKGSVAAYVDQPGSPQYNISKWGARGLFRNLRRTVGRQGMRVNFVAPWYVHTPILSDRVVEYLVSKGVKFARAEDCARAMLKIASNKEIQGRSFAIVSREESPEGYMDMVHDDYGKEDFLSNWQQIVLETAESIVNIT